MENQTNILVTALLEMQGDRSIRKFACDLQIPYNTLYQIYKGLRNPGRKTLSRLIQARPELKPAVDDFLSSDLALASDE